MAGMTTLIAEIINGEAKDMSAAITRADLFAALSSI
jgi:hypothetical protein